LRLLIIQTVVNLHSEMLNIVMSELCVLFRKREKFGSYSVRIIFFPYVNNAYNWHCLFNDAVSYS